METKELQERRHFKYGDPVLYGVGYILGAQPVIAIDHQDTASLSKIEREPDNPAASMLHRAVHRLAQETKKAGAKPLSRKEQVENLLVESSTVAYLEAESLGLPLPLYPPEAICLLSEESWQKVVDLYIDPLDISTMTKRQAEAGFDI